MDTAMDTEVHRPKRKSGIVFEKINIIKINLDFSSSPLCF